MTRVAPIFLTALLLTALPAPLSAHCQVPCGIYGDEIRFQQMEEDIATLEKSMKMIATLSAEKNINYNQLIRWVNNKEPHAQRIQQRILDYFLAPRVKPAPAGKSEARRIYLEKLETLHRMIIQAMKAKQSTDPDVVQELRTLMSRFHDLSH